MGSCEWLLKWSRDLLFTRVFSKPPFWTPRRPCRVSQGFWVYGIHGSYHEEPWRALGLIIGYAVFAVSFVLLTTNFGHKVYWIHFSFADMLEMFWVFWVLFSGILVYHYLSWSNLTLGRARLQFVRIGRRVWQENPREKVCCLYWPCKIELDYSMWSLVRPCVVCRSLAVRSCNHVPAEN